MGDHRQAKEQEKRERKREKREKREEKKRDKHSKSSTHLNPKDRDGDLDGSKKVRIKSGEDK